MFEGKKGPKIYKRKQDAEFVAERRNKAGEARTKILEIRVSDEENVQKIGASFHPDLGIAARKPEAGERGWVVIQSSGNLEEKYGNLFEILSESEVG